MAEAAARQADDLTASVANLDVCSRSDAAASTSAAAADGGAYAGGRPGTGGSTSAAAAPGGGDKPLPALFLDSMPENEEEHPDLAAMNTLMGELTPDEIAEHGRSQGNDALKQGLALRKKFYLRKAVEHYTEGIASGSSDAKLVAILYSNRAQAELRLGNARNALRDALRATLLDADNLKAYFRAAKAALDIGQYDKTREVCGLGLERVPDFPELAAILKTCERAQSRFSTNAKHQDVDAKEAAEAERQRRDVAERRAVRAPARALAATLLGRGWRIGRPQISIGTRKPSLDEHGAVWPVMFIYPETMQNDAVEAFHEHHALSDHLDAMFGPGAPPLVWDTEGSYTRERLELYYLSHSAKPVGEDELTEFLHGGWPEALPQDEGPQRYGTKCAEWVKLDQALTLAEVLAHEDYVVPGIPVFFVLSRSSPFAERFLSEDAFRL